MRNNKHFGISGRGYYIALILCAAAIGISGYVYHQNLTRAEEVGMMETAQTAASVPPQTVTPSGPAAAQSGTKPAGGNGSRPAATEATAATLPPAKRTLKTAAPLKGEEIGGYAMDCLAYNPTTRDWRVHNGVDIAAPEGTEVCAAADGTVYTAYTDDTMGPTVVIRHEGGYTTHYAGLAETFAVKAGDRVTLGQTIGAVGAPALAETALGSHLHFAVSNHDDPMDPADFLRLE